MEAKADQLLKDCTPFVKFAKLDELLSLGRANSLWPLTFGDSDEQRTSGNRHEDKGDENAEWT